MQSRKILWIFDVMCGICSDKARAGTKTCPVGIGYFKSLHTGYAIVAIFCMVNCPTVNSSSSLLGNSPRPHKRLTCKDAQETLCGKRCEQEGAFPREGKMKAWAQGHESLDTWQASGFTLHVIGEILN